MPRSNAGRRANGWKSSLSSRGRHRAAGAATAPRSRKTPPGLDASPGRATRRKARQWTTGRRQGDAAAAGRQRVRSALQSRPRGTTGAGHLPWAVGISPGPAMMDAGPRGVLVPAVARGHSAMACPGQVAGAARPPGALPGGLGAPMTRAGGAAGSWRLGCACAPGPRLCPGCPPVQCADPGLTA